MIITRRQFLASTTALVAVAIAPIVAEGQRAPSSLPTLDLDFINGGELDGRITFTRASVWFIPPVFE